MANNSRLTPQQIRRHAKSRFGKPNPLQDYVLEELIHEATARNLIFTKGAVNYLLREIEDPDILQEIAEPQAKEVLLELLAVAIDKSQKWSLGEEARARMERHYSDPLNDLVLLSYSSIVRALRVYDCPKPWC